MIEQDATISPEGALAFGFQSFSLMDEWQSFSQGDALRWSPKGFQPFQQALQYSDYDNS